MLSYESHQYLTKRMAEGNVLDKIELDPEEYKSGVRYFQITGIFDGQLEDEFIVGGLHEVNVADWLAEHYSDSLEAAEQSSYSIHVYEYNLTLDGDDDEFSVGDLVYRVDS